MSLTLFFYYTILLSLIILEMIKYNKDNYYFCLTNKVKDDD